MAFIIIVAGIRIVAAVVGFTTAHMCVKIISTECEFLEGLILFIFSFF